MWHSTPYSQSRFALLFHLFFALYLSLTAALPLSSDTNLTKVPLVYNPKYEKNGTKSYVSLLTKYSFAPTKEGPYFITDQVNEQGKHGVLKKVGGRAQVRRNVLRKRQDNGQAGEVPAEDQQNDSMYLAPVKIGTPGQKFMLDFDTGSADLWVWSTELPSSLQSQSSKHRIFNPDKSSTYKNMDGYTWKIQYGDSSSASGTVGTDNVNLGGLVVKNQGIELASQLSQQFAQGVGDGLLGLAFGSINTVRPHPVKTPVENMIEQKEIPPSAELFTAKLSSYRDNEDSFYTFGYIDQDTVKASGQDVYYTPVDNSQGFWMFGSGSATVNGKTINRSGNTAIADTGTTLALIDDNTCEAIYNAIPGAKYDQTQQGYTFPKSTSADKLPTVSFAVGGKQFYVQKEDLAFADIGNGYVYGGIQSRGSMSFDILGDTFLKSIYAIFDQGNTRFGAVQRVVQGITQIPHNFHQKRAKSYASTGIEPGLRRWQRRISP
ncbi:acid protease [Xylona heveae TC161]|uniref:Acid protease n=1 Tax=Xylona heveae (strain CBS 132557 / TC161) TaxID=1328760 RepID=A0A164ZI55_XYLHT|nr:acid protease [Xylona heveae TC161]KZF19126.1 acid protease [Xylona heveae TC161]